MIFFFLSLSSPAFPHKYTFNFGSDSLSEALVKKKKKKKIELLQSCTKLSIFNIIQQIMERKPGSSCSKLTMSLVKDSLKLTSSDMQIC